MAGEKMVPTTWGNLASQVVEAGYVQPEPEAVAEFLMIPRERLQSSAMAFRHMGEVYEYGHMLRERGKQEFWEQARERQQAFAAYLKQGSQSWKVPDIAAKVSETNDEIEEGIERMQGEGVDESEMDDQLQPLYLKRDAYETGMATSPDDVMALAFGYEGEPVHTDTELLKAVRQTIERVVNHCGPGSKVKSSDICLDSRDLQAFFNELHVSLHERARSYATQRARQVERFYLPPHSSEYALLSGTVATS